MQSGKEQTSGTFYASRCGRRAAAQVSAFIESCIKGMNGGRILTLGYATPFYAALEQSLPRIIVEADPTEAGESPSAIKVSPLSLPFPNNAFHFVLIANALERVLQPEALLKEVRRVLVHDGSAVCITPNKYSLWGVRKSAPPMRFNLFSAKEVSGMMSDALLAVKRQKSAMFLPPSAYAHNIGLLDEFLSVLPLSAGAFILTHARKQEIALTQKAVRKDYKSARITKASIFSSPRS